MVIAVGSNDEVYPIQRPELEANSGPRRRTLWSFAGHVWIMCFFVLKDVRICILVSYILCSVESRAA